ncbi:MAG: response regulator [Hyphomicrobiaceae bacterium]
MSNTITVVVVDDHPMFRQGLVWALRHSRGLSVIGEAGTTGEALSLATTLQPDVLLLDMSMHGSDTEGLAIAQLVRQSFPKIKIVILTVSEDDRHVGTALKLGVNGYVIKSVSGAEICQVVRDVHAGKQHVHPDLAARLLNQANAAPVVTEPAPPRATLTAREEQILSFVSRGLTNKEVARQLEISEKTVKHYMTAIMTKLGVRNRTEAVLYARERSDAGDRPMPPTPLQRM